VVVHLVHIEWKGTLVVHKFSSANPQISVEKFPIIIRKFFWGTFLLLVKGSLDPPKNRLKAIYARPASRSVNF
jgi:hypothetical protein